MPTAPVAPPVAGNGAPAAPLDPTLPITPSGVPVLSIGKCTLAELKAVERTVLGGASIHVAAEAHPMDVAAGLLWLATRRREVGLAYEDFEARTSFEEVSDYMALVQEVMEGPTNRPNGPT